MPESTSSVRLTSPTSGRHAEWLAMAREFDGAHLDGGGLPDGTSVEDLADPSRFAAWVDLQARFERGVGIPVGRVPASLRWIERDGELVGTIQVRHRLNGYLLASGGHIGYAVRPSARRCGNAVGALGLMLEVCRDLTINPVLVTCADDNTASARVIESCGGRLEEVCDGTRRYWIDLLDDPIGLRPLGREAAAMLAGERLSWFAPGYPRADDLDGIRMASSSGGPSGGASSESRAPEVTLWSNRHILLEGRAVGTVGFFGPPQPVSGSRPEVEIGYGLVPAARERGVITVVLSRVLAQCDAAGVAVRAHIEPGNEPSRRALLRAGFVETGPDGDEGLLFRRSGPPD